MNQVFEGLGNYEVQRLPDPPLSDKGFAQAQRLANWAAQQPVFQEVTHLYSSLMVRAVQTSEPLAQALQLPVQGLSQAYEWGGVNAGPSGQFAAVTGQGHQALQEHCPPLVWPEELAGQPWDGGYEPWEEAHFTRRAQGVVKQLQEVETQANIIALVTHRDFAQSLLRELLYLPQTCALPLQNTASTLLETRADKHDFTLHWHNRLPC